MLLLLGQVLFALALRTKRGTYTPLLLVITFVGCDSTEKTSLGGAVC
jgi:hypothetical protein